MAEDKFCQYCGHALEPNSTFCSKCGKPVLQTSLRVHPTPAVSKVADRKPSSKISRKVLVALVVSLLVMLTAIYLIRQPSPTNIQLPSQGTQGATGRVISVFTAPLPFGVDPSYLDTVRGAETYWEQRDHVVFKEVSSEGEADVTVQWVKEFGTGTLAHVLFTKFIEIGLGDSRCLGKWQAYKYDTVIALAIHEYGHALGHPHDNDPNSVMYPSTETSYAVDFRETDVLPDGYRTFYPVCTTKSVSTYVITITSNVPLDVYVVPSRGDYDLFTQGKSFNQYPACQANAITSYSKTCTVAVGSGVILRNPTTFGRGASATYTIEAQEQ